MNTKKKVHQNSNIIVAFWNPSKITWLTRIHTHAFFVCLLSLSLDTPNHLADVNGFSLYSKIMSTLRVETIATENIAGKFFAIYILRICSAKLGTSPSHEKIKKKNNKKTY